MSRMLICLSALGLWTALFGSRADAQKLSPADIAKKAKAATVIVKPDRFAGVSSSTGFCIHPSGVIVASTELWRFANPKTIEIIVNPNSNKRKKYPATILREDKSLKIAILKVDGEEKFAALPLGSTQKLSELSEVIACGFPPTSGAIEAGLPNLMVNKGEVTSLQNVSGKPHRILVNINPGGTPGGPLLDMSGKVVGVMTAARVVPVQNGAALAIDRITALAQKPIIHFTNPATTVSNRDKEVEFKAEVIQLFSTDPKAELKAELILDTLGKKRTIPMTKGEDNIFRAKAVPLPVELADSLLQAEVKFASGSIKGTVKDREIKIGFVTLDLADLDQIKLASNAGGIAEAVHYDGKKTRGKLRVKTLPITIDEQTFEVNIEKATEIKIVSAKRKAVIGVTVVVKQNGKEIGRSESSQGSNARRVTGQLARGEMKSHAYTMKAGKTYVIEMKSSSFDCYLYLYDPNGRIVAVNDDGGVGLNSRIVYRALRTGVYTVKAGSLGSRGMGEYTLSIEQSPIPGGVNPLLPGINPFPPQFPKRN